MKKSFEAGNSDRLFHTLVVLGAALATACGGLADDADGATGTGGSSNDGSGGTSSGGNTVSSGGSSVASGGSPGSGGTIELDPAPVPPDDYDCPPAQWDCADAQIAYDYGGARLLDPESCSCEPQRPAVLSDCAPGEDFVCLNWTVRADYHPFTTPVLLECSCSPQVEYCSTACDVFEEPGTGIGLDHLGSCEPDPMSPRSILCGFAPVVLK